MSTVNGPSDFVNAAYRLGDQDAMLEFYRKWARDYDHQMLESLGYSAPTTIARHLSRCLPDRDARVFDVGCGTGLSCIFLAAKGYLNLDGIDLSPHMVQVASERNIYRKLMVGDINQRLDCADAVYDGVISSGTFTHGHVGPAPLDEIFRLLKPGGVLACTIHEDLWETMGFKAKFDSLVDAESARCVFLKKGRYYKNGPPEGWFCVYRKVT